MEDIEFARGPLHMEPEHGWAPVAQGRLVPLDRHQLACWLRAVVWLLERGARVPASNLFLTLLRHPRLFLAWLRFASRLMPRGSISRQDTEILILRTAWRCRSRYEWVQHVQIGRRVGLSDAELYWLAGAVEPAGIGPRAAALRDCADDYHQHRAISQEIWTTLRQHYDDKALIEITMTLAHYEMLAGVIVTLGVAVED